MGKRVPASMATRQQLSDLIEGHLSSPDGRGELIKLATRLIVEEALEAEAGEALGRDYYQHGGNPEQGYRNGNRWGRLKTAEGFMAFSAPQIAGRSEPFHSEIREHLKGHSQALEDLTVEMLARGLSVRDIEDAFRDENGRLLLSRTAASEMGERLWADYQNFISRDLGKYEIVYLYVNGVAERLRPGQRREPVLAAWGFSSEGKRILLHLMACFMDDFESCIAHLRMPVNHRRAIRTTNLLERLFVEERRRLKIIPNAFGEKPVLKLMFGAMIRAAERWRPIKITLFERRQMEATRKELDQEYEAQNGLAKQTSKEAAADNLSSRNRT